MSPLLYSQKDKMKVLLLGINARYTHSNLALYYLRTMIYDYDMEVELKETSINADILETLALINESDCDVICLSAYIWNSDYISKLTPMIKAIKPDCTIVMGGPEVSFDNPFMEETLNLVDKIIVGPGELAFQYLAYNEFCGEYEIIQGQHISIKELPFPYLESDKELLKGKYIYYEASRGCPYKCSFCLSSRDDIPFEYKEIEVVKQELKQLLSFQPRVVKLVDRSFNANREFAREVWAYLAELNPNTTFHFEIKPDIVTEEDIALLKTMPKGLLQFEIGLQTTNPRTLDAVSRRSRFDKVESILRQLNTLDNIHVHLDLIAGLPFEDLDSFEQSFNQAISTAPQYLQLGVLKVLPGTEMAEDAEEYEIKSMSSPPYQILSNEWMSFKDLTYMDKFTHFFDLYYNSERLPNTMSYLSPRLENPFRFFQGLMSHCISKGFEPKKDYYLAYSLLIEYLSMDYPGFVDYCKDSLRYDWCLYVHKPHLPKALVQISAKELKDSIYQILRVPESELPQELLPAKPYFKKALYATFSNNEFINATLKGNTKLIVYKNDSKIENVAF